MASDITITSLTAVGAVGQVFLSAIYGTPDGLGCLPYMQPAKFEFWSSATNNRNAATKIGEATVGLFTHNGLTDANTRYYWARAVDANGEPGEFFPSSPTGGIAGAPSNAAITPITNALSTRITNEETQRISADSAQASRISTVEATLNNPTTGVLARITTEENARVTADNALATRATNLEASYNGVSAQGRLQFSVAAAPSGYSASMDMFIKGSAGGAAQYAGLSADVGGPEGGRLRLIGSKIRFQDSGGNVIALFQSDGKIVSALIPKIIAGQLEAGVINAQSLFVNGVVFTDAIQGNAVTTIVQTGKAGTFGPNSQMQQASIGTGSGQTGVSIDVSCFLNRPSENSSNFGDLAVILRRNGSEIDRRQTFYDDNFAYPIGWSFADNSPGSNPTYSLFCTNLSGAGQWSIKDANMKLTLFKR